MPTDNCSTDIYGPVGSNENTCTDQGGGTVNGGGSGTTSGAGGGGSVGGFGSGISASSDWSSVANRARMQFVYQGNAMVGTFSVQVNNAPFDPASNKIVFTLTTERFSRTPIWVGTLGDGITASAGVVTVSIPQSIADNLRRGGFTYTLAVTDLYGRTSRTHYEGRLLVEYTAGSPNPDIPYRDGADATQNNVSPSLPTYP